MFLSHAPGSLTPPPAPADDDLIFMTHAPGAVVPPRAQPRESVVSSVLLGPFRVRRKGAPGEPEPGGARPTGRRGVAAQLQEGAGRAALERARAAARRSAASRRFQPPDLESPRAPTPGAAAPASPEVVVATPTTSYLAQVPGALFAPLRGFPVTFVQAFLLWIGLMLFELSVPLGLAGLAIGLCSLANVVVRMIRDGCGDRDLIVWPDLGALIPSTLLVSAALLNLAPAAALALAAWGAPAWSGPSSLPARAVYAVSGAREAPSPGRKAQPQSVGHHPLRVLAALVADRVDAPRQSTTALAESVREHASRRLADLGRVEDASPLGQGARAAALLGLLVAPIAFLCAVRIRSAYGAIFLPIAVRSALRVAGPYTIPLAGLVVWGAAAAVVAFAGPSVLRTELGAATGHLAWAAAVALVATAGAMVNAALLARLYRTRQLVLAWD